jgi:ABC-type transporter Mla MlaB component
MTGGSFSWRDNSLCLSGAVTMLTVTPLVKQLDSELKHFSGDELIIDCGEMSAGDSAAIALLVELRKQLEPLKVSLQVKGISAQLRSLIQLYGVEWLLDVNPTGHASG